MPAQKRVSPQNEARNEEIEGGVTTIADLSGGNPAPIQEVEVDAIEETVAQPVGTPTVVIRVNETIEDMSYVAEGKVERYTFETGNRYRVPLHIARELEAMGKIWH